MKRVLSQLSLIVCISFSALAQNNSSIHITFFGSSVCRGAGAEDYHGYGWQFFNSGAIDTLQYKYFNASTGGDNTIKVEREDRISKKLLPTDPDIVVIGLSLANEGIMNARNDNGREQIVEQFRSRLLAMADSFSSMGIKPVIVNCYAQSFFTRSHYECTKKMNRIINTWKYPSINVLGTIDDFEGKWVEGYVRDAGHPNTAGHLEMSYAIVPSLFDAILMGSVKEQLSPTQIHFGGTASDTELKDLTLHRSSLNKSEALDLFNKKFIQSSLEFYNPLTQSSTGNYLKNYAQSLSVLKIDNHVTVQHHQVDF